MDSNPSAGVRLEVAILAAGQTAPAAAPRAASDEPVRLTVLVVAAETDERWYVRECLRDCTDVRVLEAATVAVALTLAVQSDLDLLIIDAPQGDVLMALSRVRAVVIVDDLPRRPQLDGARVRFLARPFTAHQVVAEVDRVRTVTTSQSTG
jgi:hypothetical protein